MFHSFGKRIALLGALVLGGAGMTFAGENPSNELSLSPLMLADEAPPKKISGDAGAGFLTDYISRGIQLENQGLVVQPYANLYFSLYDGPEGALVKNITGSVGIWSSLHSHLTEGVSDLSFKNWYEFDWDVFVQASIGDFTMRLMYIEFTSPANGFGRAKNVEFKVGYDDSKLAESYYKFALAPYALIFFETDGKAGTGSGLGQYIELGIGPTYKIDDVQKLVFPLFVGLGINDFYGNADGENETYGYAAGGVTYYRTLTFLSDRGYGSWVLGVGGLVYHFGAGTRTANQGAATGAAWDLVGSVSIAVSF